MKLAITVGTVLALAMASPALAQNHTIDGVSVGPDQLTAVQARCDELQSLHMSSSAVGLSAEPSAEPEAEASAPGATDQPVPESPAEDSVEPADSSSMPATPFDLALITYEQCEAGGFYSAM